MMRFPDDHSAGQAVRLRELGAAFPRVVLAGARQVGKSTLVEYVLGPPWDTVTFGPFQDIGNARADPDLFLDRHPSPLSLDEISFALEVVGL